MHQSDFEEHADIGGDTCYTDDDRGTRKLLFKKRSTSSTCAVNITTINVTVMQCRIALYRNEKCYSVGWIEFAEPP